MNDSHVEIPWCVETVVGPTWIAGQGVSELPARVSSRTNRTTLLTFSYNPITINFTTDMPGPCANLHSGEKHTQQRIGKPTVCTFLKGTNPNTFEKLKKKMCALRMNNYHLKSEIN